MVSVTEGAVLRLLTANVYLSLAPNSWHGKTARHPELPYEEDYLISILTEIPTSNLFGCTGTITRRIT